MMSRAARRARRECGPQTFEKGCRRLARATHFGRNRPIERFWNWFGGSIRDLLSGYRYNGIASVPRKIRELVRNLQDAGFAIVPSGGKGSHRKFTHPNYAGAVTLSGQDGDDAKKYQEKQVTRAIEQVER